MPVEVVILGSDFITVQIGFQAFTGALSQRGIAKQIEAIAKLPVPIVKFIEKRSGVSFHIRQVGTFIQVGSKWEAFGLPSPLDSKK
ncbi:hypothetical protein CsSME_00018566 [Camellia sinensis var. sinensis]